MPQDDVGHSLTRGLDGGGTRITQRQLIFQNGGGNQRADAADADVGGVLHGVAKGEGAILRATQTDADVKT